MTTRRRKKIYKSKSYRAFIARLHTKYPVASRFAELISVQCSMPGFTRRLLSPETARTTPSTPMCDGFNSEFCEYDRRQSYDHLCPMP